MSRKCQEHIEKTSKLETRCALTSPSLNLRKEPIRRKIGRCLPIVLGLGSKTSIFHADAHPDTLKSRVGAADLALWWIGSWSLPDSVSTPRGSLVHNNLALHVLMTQTTTVTAPKRVRAGRLREKFNCGCFSLFKLPAVLRRSQN